MKKNVLLLTLSLFGFVQWGCTETESQFEDVPQEQVISQITLSASQVNVTVGSSVTFQVISNLNTNLTANAVFTVNNQEIQGNSHTFAEAGVYAVRAIYQNTISDIVQITVIATSQTVSFVSRVLVEEYSGTWCGNCPRILYGTELLKQQTDKAVTVQIHLFNGDPFITSRGNAIASSLGISGVPSGRINRTTVWNSPQYQNVNQVINAIDASAEVGLAITSAVTSGVLNVTVTMGFSNPSSATKLVVYVVEDNLRHTQANYSSNLYGGLSSIPNFRYDGVFRAEVTPPNGETITATGTTVQQTYAMALTNVSSVSNAKVVAFLIDTASNKVLNVRQAAVGQSQGLEYLD